MVETKKFLNRMISSRRIRTIFYWIGCEFRSELFLSRSSFSMIHGNRLGCVLILILSFACFGCNSQSQNPEPFRFLGLADNESSSEGPAGMIGGNVVQLPNVSKVSEAPYSEYRLAKKDSKIFAEEIHDDYVYWAVKESRDVPFENATAWVTVVDRYRSKVE